jgi:hypothetical protein
MTAHPTADEASIVARRRYRIVVKGRLSERFGSAFPGVQLEPLVLQTALVGEFSDQSQLDAVLDRLQDFAIEVVSVNADA